MLGGLLRAARALPKSQAARQLSAGGSQAEHIEVMEKWKKISYVGIPAVALFGTMTMYNHFAHHHHSEPPPAYSHMKIRSKPFPWGAKDCDMWDFACKKTYWEEATD